MYTEMLARANLASIQQELEASRWTREWRALARSARGSSNQGRQSYPACVSPKASLPEGR